jgi:hypothetical protein
MEVGMIAEAKARVNHLLGRFFSLSWIFAYKRMKYLHQAFLYMVPQTP